MPELPEVEVCRLGISPHVVNNEVTKVIVRNTQLRWPIPEEVQEIVGHSVIKVD